MDVDSGTVTQLMCAVNLPLPREICYTSDIETPVEALLREQIIPSPITLAGDETDLSYGARQELGIDPRLHAWRIGELEKIEKYRKFLDNWDGYGAEAPKSEALDVAETLIDYFAGLPKNRRPNVDVDAHGNPSFFLEDKGLYFHMTVELSDEGGVLSWLGEKDGADYSEDVMVFNGERLPEKISTLLDA